MEFTDEMLSEQQLITHGFLCLAQYLAVELEE